MCILIKNNEMSLQKAISLIINKLKFFNMSKVKKVNPVLQRNGEIVSYMLSINLLQILA